MTKKEAKVSKDADGDVMICRCEEVSKREIRDAIQFGAEDLNEVKRMTRAGMGLCQGRTCRRLITQIFSEETGTPSSEVEPSTFRPPVRPLSVETLSDAFDVVAEMHAGSEAKVKEKPEVEPEVKKRDEAKS